MSVTNLIRGITVDCDLTNSPQVVMIPGSGPDHWLKSPLGEQAYIKSSDRAIHVVEEGHASASSGWECWGQEAGLLTGETGGRGLNVHVVTCD